MAKFNGQELSWASNINNVSTEVWLIFMRKSGTDWEYVEVPSTSNANITLDNTGAIDIKSESRGTAVKVTQNKANVSFDLTENAGLSFISKLYGLTKASTVAGAKTITDRVMVFGEDDIIEFKEISNDSNGVTTITMKDSDWVAITNTADADFTTEVIWNITRITRVDTGAITAGDTVLVSGSVNLNAQETAEYNASYVSLEKFDMRVAVEVIEAGVAKYRLKELNPVRLNSTYVLPFLNAVTAGGAQNTSLQFDLDEEGKITMVEELL